MMFLFFFFKQKTAYEIFHRETPDRCIGMEVICLDLATVAGKLGLNIILQLGDRLRAGRTRAEADLLGHLSESTLAVEAAGLFGRGRVIRGLRWSGGDSAHEWRLAGGAG